jgi:hypothetical protein
MKYSISIIAAAMLFLAGACKKDFLDKSDPTRLASEGFYKNTAEINQALSGCYSQLQAIINGQWLFNELITDNTTVDFNPSDRGQADRVEAFEYWTVNASNVNNTQLYNQYYNAIYNINTALLKLQNTAIPDSAKKVVEGQLKFLRGYHYFELTQYYGDVILILEPFNDPAKAYDYARVPVAEVYMQIEKDLTEAAGMLPDRYNAQNIGRITKGAAISLLGKVYLTEKKYTEAINTLNGVLTLGYTLVPDYADNFNPARKNGPESIFEIQYSGSNTLGEWSNFIYTFAPRLSGAAITGYAQSNPSGYNIPTKDIIAAYESGDARKAASIGMNYTRPSTSEVIPYIKKYAHAHATFGRTDNNWPVLRYADVLLMLAEAINESQGPTAEAYNYLNQVRQRAGLVAVSGLSQPAFRDKVLHERRIELAFENWRWFDLKRTKTPAELAAFLNAYAAAEKANPTVSRQGIPFSAFDYIFQPTEVLYPIPANEILINKSLPQNSGY